MHDVQAERGSSIPTLSSFDMHFWTMGLGLSVSFEYIHVGLERRVVPTIPILYRRPKNRVDLVLGAIGNESLCGRLIFADTPRHVGRKAPRFPGTVRFEVARKAARMPTPTLSPKP